MNERTAYIAIAILLITIIGYIYRKQFKAHFKMIVAYGFVFMLLIAFADWLFSANIPLN